ncbi:MAG TPA: hemerythrin domain-containing protein [Brevundimonas sp.]|jgi:hypothetical protein|uniref:hemerythrin domain-containing protein n=1 Tax=Brevundimonas sp. TaxID=1871086 RepID=UPI002E134EF8|nr:hemerythrin domain-containing protein [Brevundimonas sp.]
MTATAQLRDEHDRILRQASGLAGIVDRDLTRDLASEARAAIVGLDRLLVVHLTTEDDWMYPMLMASADQRVSAAAGACFQDMGGLLGAWLAYRDHWSAEAILSAPERFRAATRGVIGALALRIERENAELYPLVDRLAGGPSGSVGAV